MYIFQCILLLKNHIHPQRIKISSGNESQYSSDPEGCFPGKVAHILSNIYVDVLRNMHVDS